MVKIGCGFSKFIMLVGLLRNYWHYYQFTSLCRAFSPSTLDPFYSGPLGATGPNRSILSIKPLCGPLDSLFLLKFPISFYLRASLFLFVFVLKIYWKRASFNLVFTIGLLIVYEGVYKVWNMKQRIRFCAAATTFSFFV